MTVFDPIELVWEGKTLVIPQEQVFEVGIRVEEVLTMVELASYASSGRVPMFRLARAWSVILRHAGIRVSEEEVFVKMLKGKQTEQVALNVRILLAALMPSEEVLAENKSGNVSRGEVKSSKKSSRPRSRTNGSRRPLTSGASAPSSSG
jgi:hypothetical protein